MHINDTRSYTIILSLFIALLFGCSKSEDPQPDPTPTPPPTPTTGIISGSISPASANITIRVTGQDSKVFNLNPDASGAFSFKDLKPMEYFVQMMPAQNYEMFDSRWVTVTAGNTVDLGKITLCVNRGGQVTGTIRWVVNGVSKGPFPLSGTNPGFPMIFRAANGERPAFVTYSPAVGAVSASATYEIPGPGISNPFSQATRENTNLTYTSVDQCQKKAAGTFEFTATGAAGTFHVTGSLQLDSF